MSATASPGGGCADGTSGSVGHGSVGDGSIGHGRAGLVRTGPIGEPPEPGVDAIGARPPMMQREARRPAEILRTDHYAIALTTILRLAAGELCLVGIFGHWGDRQDLPGQRHREAADHGA